VVGGFRPSFLYVSFRYQMKNGKPTNGTEYTFPWYVMLSSAAGRKRFLPTALITSFTFIASPF
jgi:hypothetical protein